MSAAALGMALVRGARNDAASDRVEADVAADDAASPHDATKLQCRLFILLGRRRYRTWLAWKIRRRWAVRKSARRAVRSAPTYFPPDSAARCTVHRALCTVSQRPCP